MNIKNLWLTTDAALTRVIKWSVIIAAVGVGVMMLIATVDVIGTKFFNWSIKGGVEFIEEMNILLVFLSIGYVELERGHIRIGILEQYVSKASQGLTYALKLFRYLVGILVIGFLSWRTIEFVQRMLATGTTKNSPIDFPLWPSALVVFIGFTFLTIAYLLLLVRTIIAKPKG